MMTDIIVEQHIPIDGNINGANKNDVFNRDSLSDEDLLR